MQYSFCCATYHLSLDENTRVHVMVSVTCLANYSCLLHCFS